MYIEIQSIITGEKPDATRCLTISVSINKKIDFDVYLNITTNTYQMKRKLFQRDYQANIIVKVLFRKRDINLQNQARILRLTSYIN